VVTTERVDVRGIPLDVLRRGAGRPILLLHGEAPLDPGAPVLDLLAAPGGSPTRECWNVRPDPRQQEIASTALFLASDDASFFTGEILHPSGGVFVG